MIRDSLAIVVVARRHPERLSDTLTALVADKVPGDVTIVNLTGSDIESRGHTVVTADPSLSLSHAIDRAIAESAAETLWILRDDARVRPGAFASLASILDTSPSVGVVGPKQMDAGAPATIREMGESMTRGGISVQLAERELDQAQYDRTSDVLAVGEAGMLVRRAVWASLGGFDPALPAVDGALDFCYRARSAGWLVEVVPAAVIETAGTSFEALAGSVTDAQVVTEEARSRAHRLSVYSAGAARPLLGIALVIGAIIRGFWRFTQKASHPFAEWRGTVSGLLDVGAISRARRSFRSIRTNPVDGPRLFVTHSEMRHRRALERDERRAALEAADVVPRLAFGATGLWWTGFFTLAALVLGNTLLGSSALSGGALLPMPATIGEAWAAIGATWSDVAGGFVGAPDGFAALLGVLGTLTWWNPNHIVIAIVVLSLPLSFVAGYVGAGALTTNTRAATIVGALWAVLPTLHIALSEGRISAVLAHIALPLFARAISGSTIVSLGWASITAAIVWVSVPALAPVIVLIVVMRAISGNAGVLAVVAPALAFEWPRLVAAVANPVAYFADRGLPMPTTAPHGVLSLTLWPGVPNIPMVGADVAALVAGTIVATALALTVISVVVADNPRVGAVLVAGGIAMVVWFAVGSTALATVDGTSVGLFPGPLYDVVWFGLIAGTAITIASIRFAAGFLAPVSVVLVALVGIVPLTAVWAKTAFVAPSTTRTLPAFVEAESRAHPGGATLILTPSDEGLRVELQRDEGVTLVDWTAAAATRTDLGPQEYAIAEIAANLIVESGFDLAAAVAEQGIRFVVLAAEPTATEVSAIASHAGLTSVGVTDRGILWRVTTDVTTTPVDRRPDVLYRVILGVVGLIALIAAVPTSLPRRRPVDDDLIPLTDEDDDEHS